MIPTFQEIGFIYSKKSNFKIRQSFLTHETWILIRKEYKSLESESPKRQVCQLVALLVVVVVVVAVF